MLRLLCLLRSAPCSVNASLSAARALLAQQNVYSEGVELPQDSTITDQAPMCGSTQHGPVPGQQQAPPAPQASSTSSSEIEALEVSALLIAKFHNQFALLTRPAGLQCLATC